LKLIDTSQVWQIIFRLVNHADLTLMTANDRNTPVSGEKLFDFEAVASVCHRYYNKTSIGRSTMAINTPSIT